VAKITQRFPFDAEEVDVLVSRWVLEHLENVESFIEGSENIL
jgi:hypothetical protein